MNTILSVKQLTKNFMTQGKQFSLTGINLDLQKGEVICLVGPSGSGKSTLLRCLAGLEPIDSGEIVLLGQHNLHTQDEAAKKALSDNVSLVVQDFNLWPHKTVLENIILAPVITKKMARPAATESALKLLRKFGLYDQRDAYPDFLSGGQKQRVAIIRALVMQPKVLLLDEITSALDPVLVSSVLNVIKVLAKEGQSMIIVTHHLKFATEIASKIIYLEGGRLIQESTPRDFLYSQENQRISDFIKPLSINKQEINIYEGRDQFQAFQHGVLKRFKKGSSLCVVGSSGDRWFEVMGDYYADYEKLRVERQIGWRMIMYSESPLDRSLRLRHPLLNEYRLFPKDFENPANYYVIDDVVVIQIFGKKGDEPAIIEIKNASVAKSYMHYFNLIWEQSQPIVD